jgi:hypothetical protein
VPVAAAAASNRIRAFSGRGVPPAAAVRLQVRRPLAVAVSVAPSRVLRNADSSVCTRCRSRSRRRRHTCSNSTARGSESSRSHTRNGIRNPCRRRRKGGRELRINHAPSVSHALDASQDTHPLRQRPSNIVAFRLSVASATLGRVARFSVPLRTSSRGKHQVWASGFCSRSGGPPRPTSSDLCRLVRSLPGPRNQPTELTLTGTSGQQQHEEGPKEDSGANTARRGGQGTGPVRDEYIYSDGSAVHLWRSY